MESRFIIVLVLFVFATSYSQTVSTITGQVNASGDIAIDSSGNIYVANFGQLLNGPGSGGGQEVYKVTPDGDVSVFATGLNGASGNEFGPDGYLYQSNISIGTISKISPQGDVATFSIGHSAPVGITFDKEGNLYSANCGSNQIIKVAPNGTKTVFASSALLACPNGLTIDDDGNIYTANFGNGNVLKINTNGLVTLLANLPGNNNGHITYRNGRLYVVSRGGNKIYELMLDGTWKVLAGTGARGKLDGPANEATFSLPNGIGVSPDGNTIYVNDEINLVSNVILNPVVVRKIENIFGTTSVEENIQPNEYSLKQNYPNPFNPSTKIEYYIPKSAFTVLKIYDTLGREIRTLVNKFQLSGRHEIKFEANNIGSGIYFYILRSGEFASSKKMLLLK